MAIKKDAKIRSKPSSVEKKPRLNPDKTYSHLKEFAEEMTSTDADRIDFINLAKSIVKKGFIPADPIVVWQYFKNKKFYVAEGNRRVAVANKNISLSSLSYLL